jgi:hypothetical protein
LDIDLSRVRAGSGVELLRNYLQYAASDGKKLGDADVTGEPLNAFEAEVFDCLSTAGLKLIPQMGASQFRIDMVAEQITVGSQIQPDRQLFQFFRSYVPLRC